MGARRFRVAARPFALRAIGEAALVLVLAVAAGCSALGIGGDANSNDIPHAYPGGCADFDLSPRRCKWIVETLMEGVGLAPAEVARIELLGDPGCGEANQPHVLCTRTVSLVVRVRFVGLDGQAQEELAWCGPGRQNTPFCAENPEIGIRVPIDGYMDVPCGETGDTCATHHPTPDAAVRAQEVPLVVDSMQIPIDHLGAYEVPLGNGALAGGILERSSLTVGDPKPMSFLLGQGGLQLEIKSLAPDGRPFDNYYVHGWREGLEPFSARLTFEVDWFEPGAILVVTGIRVE
jgi:hypothetical protein